MKPLTLLLTLGTLLAVGTPAGAAPSYPGESWNQGLQPGKDTLPDLAPGVTKPLLVQSDSTAAWAVVPVERLSTPGDEAPDVVVRPSVTYQTMVGYGGAFNEKGWAALATVSPAERQRVLNALFDPVKGLGFTVCRIPIGASDYALSRYSLDDQPGDWSLDHFSIDRDKQALIPYIRAAQAVQPGLKFWASAWSPPGWMKTNGTSDSGALIDDPKVYDALARYDVKFLKAYAAEGIAVDRIAVQNEPTVLTNYPSCSWTPDQFRRFVGTHLGPVLKAEAPGTQVLLGTFNDPRNADFLRAVLADPVAAPFVGAIGLQWEGDQALPQVANLLGTLPLMQTETDCGNWSWKPGYNPDFPQNDFEYAAYTWNKVRTYFKAGVVSYDLWNMVLDETGKSIDSKMPWPQDSPVVIDTVAHQVHLTPMFHAFGHFARYGGPGSVRVGTSGFAYSIAFRRPDGSLAVEVLNTWTKPQTLVVRIDGADYRFTLTPHSFATLLVPKAP